MEIGGVEYLTCFHCDFKTSSAWTLGQALLPITRGEKKEEVVRQHFVPRKNPTWTQRRCAFAPSPFCIFQDFFLFLLPLETMNFTPLNKIVKEGRVIYFPVLHAQKINYTLEK